MELWNFSSPLSAFPPLPKKTDLRCSGCSFRRAATAQLTILSNAGLVVSRREGRSIIYAADYDGMSELLVYLMEDCCQGRPEMCAPLVEVASRAACCDRPRGAPS